MSNGVRITLAVLAGVAIGGIVNMGIITLGPMLIPPPAGADLTTAEGLKAAIPLMEPKHFATPFLAHALGTLIGAFVAAALAPSRRALAAYVVGVLFLAGGIAASVMIPAPMWFIGLDLLVAYFPMAWLGLFLATRWKESTAKP